MPKTIKQDDYPQFFEYYKNLIKEMDDELGGLMNYPWSNPLFFYKNWEEIKSNMLNTMHNSIRELGERFKNNKEL